MFENEPIKIGSLNLGLLHIFFSKVPEYFKRRKLAGPWLRDYLQTNPLDVLMLQEVWRPEDQALIEEALIDQHFVFKHEPKYKDAVGLMIVCRRDSHIKPIQSEFRPYRAGWKRNSRAFHEFITGYLRGAMAVTCQGSRGEKIHFFNTHLTPFEKNFRLRASQLEALGEHIALTRKAKDSLVIGGDINHSTAYLSESQKAEANEILRKFLAEHDLHDSTQDLVTYNPAKNSLAQKVKWGNAGKDLCLDRIWIGPTPQWTSSNIEIFAENSITEHHETPLHISDHYGVRLSASFGLSDSGKDQESVLLRGP